MERSDGTEAPRALEAQDEFASASQREWKENIREELRELERGDNGEEHRAPPEPLSLPEVLDSLPVERWVGSAVRKFFKAPEKKPDKKKKKRRKKRRRK